MLNGRLKILAFPEFQEEWTKENNSGIVLQSITQDIIDTEESVKQCDRHSIRYPLRRNKKKLIRN